MLEQLKQEVWKACEMLPAQGLAILTWGNVSGIDREAGAIAIKPSGVDYRTMTPEDIVIVALDGTVLEGTLHPSSDLKTHLDLYNAWPQIGAIVHTHSKYATIQSQAGLDLQPFGTTHADTFYGPVPCTRLLRDEEIQGDYEKATGDVILETFQERSLDPLAVPAVLVNGHGPFAWADTPVHAVETAMVLEQCAEMAIMDDLLCPGHGAISQSLLDRHYQRKHGPHATYGQR